MVCWCRDPIRTVACSQALSLRQVVSAAILDISQGCSGPRTAINKVEICRAVLRRRSLKFASVGCGVYLSEWPSLSYIVTSVLSHVSSAAEGMPVPWRQGDCRTGHVGVARRPSLWRSGFHVSISQVSSRPAREDSICEPAALGRDVDAEQSGGHVRCCQGPPAAAGLGLAWAASIIEWCSTVQGCSVAVSARCPECADLRPIRWHPSATPTSKHLAFEL